MYKRLDGSVIRFCILGGILTTEIHETLEKGVQSGRSKSATLLLLYLQNVEEKRIRMQISQSFDRYDKARKDVLKQFETMVI